eukprot:4159511-Pleurochrysis_carterae.AAC.1
MRVLDARARLEAILRQRVCRRAAARVGMEARCVGRGDEGMERDDRLGDDGLDLLPHAVDLIMRRPAIRFERRKHFAHGPLARLSRSRLRIARRHCSRRSWSCIESECTTRRRSALTTAPACRDVLSCWKLIVQCCVGIDCTRLLGP